jgi:hypothetical protein
LDLPEIRDVDLEVNELSVRVAAAVYQAQALEEARLFDVMDHIAEQFQAGALPLSRGGGDALYAYILDRDGRLSARERATLYARVLGRGDNVSGTVNREFDALWFRFLRSVSEFERLHGASGGAIGGSSASAVRTAGRDLAANLSLSASGGTVFHADALTAQVTDVLEILSTPELLSAYDASDMWRLVDKIAADELGQSVNSARARTLAREGGRILSLVADQSSMWASAGPLERDEEQTLREIARSANVILNALDDEE